MSVRQLQVFLSSKMRRNVLHAERQAARKAILSFGGITRVWDWETCAHASNKPPLQVCLQAVRESHALVLILGRDLTYHTKREHGEAVKNRIPDFVFVKKSRSLLNRDARRYLARRRCTYRPFGSTRELRTYIQSSLRKHVIDVYLEGATRLGIGTQSEYVAATPTRSQRGRGAAP
jgi:hypothetical protein